MAGMAQRGALTACPNSKRKAALDDGLSNGENDVAVDADADAAARMIEAAHQGKQKAVPRKPTTKAVMSQAWIDSVLADETKPLPFNERLLADPELAEIFASHEQSRANFAEYQDAIRREVETKGYVEIDDDYDEMCELLQAVHEAAFYGREEEEKAAMAKLAALQEEKDAMAKLSALRR